MIPKNIKIKKKSLPDSPGAYFYFDKKEQLLYIGKATSLKRRVESYFVKAHDNRIAEMVSNISRIDYITTPSVIEALVLEANQIKAKRPKYNVLLLDDKTFLYLTITNDTFPRPVLMRGHELSRLGVDPFKKELSQKAKKKFVRIFGPYTSSTSLKKALELIRKMIPWSDCLSPEETRKKRQCFNAHLRKCPGVCSGKISKEEYKKIIRQLIMFFDGKKKQLIKEMKKEMLLASKEQRYEDADKYKRNMFAFEHIRDIALISKEDYELPLSRTAQSIIDLHSRIEAYDISNISGTSAVGSMVVFEEGKPFKKLYRKFKIKTVKGTNDVAMLEEVMIRRLRRHELYPNTWPLPEIMIIDGGTPQVNRVQKVLDEFNIKVPIIGIAKGFDRKQDQLIFNCQDKELIAISKRGKEIFQKARDEAHRFAVKYHRKVRSKKMLT